MEQTQLLDWDGEGGLEDPAGGAGETPRPVGRLHLLSSKYGPERDFWIYPGENVIGRLESCQICLPMASVSKAHAMIEVPSPDGPHLLYDQGSLNRTRRQRVVLIPQVRYSLQDGDALLFGDVGCQYFMMVPGGEPESPNESMELPPTQATMEASPLVIEETPTPGRKRMGFGGVLVQDSDKEEEEEELRNGAGRILHLSKSDGPDSSIKDGTREDSNSSASKFFSPSATVVPESDEESEEPSSSSPSGPALHLSFESHIDEPGHLENGTVPPLNQEKHPAWPAAVEPEPKATSDSGEPAAKEQRIPRDPSVIDVHLDSDTDVEDEKEKGSASEIPGSRTLTKDSFSLEVSSDTDSKESVVAKPDVGCKKDHQVVTDVGSDTDVEEAAESSGVSGLKPHQPAQNEDDDTDVEGAVEDLGTACPKNCGTGLPNEGSDKGVEDMGDNPRGHQPDEKRSSSTGVEEVANNPDLSLQVQQPAEKEAEEVEILKVESAQEVQEVAGDNSDDTDVEVIDAELEAPGGGGGPHSCSTSCRDGNVDGEEICTQRVDLQSDDNLAFGSGCASDAQEIKNLSTEVQRSQSGSSEKSSNFVVKEPMEIPGVVQNPTSLRPKQYLPVISVDSGTDVEDASESPEVKESHGVAGDGTRGKDAESFLEDPDAGPQKSSGPGEDAGPQKSSSPGEDEGSDTDVEVVSPTQRPSGAGRDGSSDTDVEVISPTHRPTMIQDSDTDVEEVIAPLPGKTIEEQDTQLIPAGSWVDGEKSASSVAEHEPCEEEEDTDGDRLKSCERDENNTADDSDLAFQATQCYLPPDTSSPKPGKTRLITGLAYSSPSKDDDSDPDAYMLVATQAFCKEPGQISDEPTQAFAAEEEETELFFQYPPEGGELSEQPTQAAVPIAASRAQQPDRLSKNSTQLYSTGLPCSSQTVPLPAGGTATEKSDEKEERKPAGSVPVPSADGSHPLVLQEVDEVVRSQEQLCVVASDAESPAEHSQTHRRAGHFDSESSERSSMPAKGAGNAEQLPECSTEGPSESVACAPVRRRSLRSSSATVSPATVPEGRSRRGQVEVANADVSCKPVGRLTRCRGLRQLGKPTQYMREPKKKMEQPEEEVVNPKKKPRNGELAVVVRQRRARGLQQESHADCGSKEETEVAVDNPRTRGPAKRGQLRTAVKLLEKQPELPRTRANSRQLGSSSATTPSPKDSGEAAKPRQEPVEPTSSSRRRSWRQSTDSKPVETRSQKRLLASSTPAPKVLFTGVIDEEGEHVVTELGGSLATSVFDCTHLVTDRVRRTVKFLCALARGIPIVTLDWLEKSRRNSLFLAPDNFLICDPEQEKNFLFSLTESLQKVRQMGGMLRGYEIHVTPNVKPEPEHMRDIIKCSGGTFLSRMPRAYKDKRIVISCPEDLPRCKAAQDAQLPIANSEFILTGILQQKVDLEAHCLDTPSIASPTASAIRTSKRKATVCTAPVPPSRAKRRR